MQENEMLLQQQQASVLETNKVLRNTYALLSMTLFFSAIMAAVAMATNAPSLNIWITLGGYFLLLFLTHKFAESGLGLVFVFALTGFLGYTIGPFLNAVVGVAGYEPIVLALGGTGFIFFTLSGYVLVTKKDLSFMTGFLMTGMIVAFVAAIANVFLQIQGLGLAVSCLFLLVSSGILMWQTSSIIHGGERNYILATVTLFVSLYNIFISLLNLIMAFSGDD